MKYLKLFEQVVEPKFKVGDEVYYHGTQKDYYGDYRIMRIWPVRDGNIRYDIRSTNYPTKLTKAAISGAFEKSLFSSKDEWEKIERKKREKWNIDDPFGEEKYENKLYEEIIVFEKGDTIVAKKDVETDLSILFRKGNIYIIDDISITNNGNFYIVQNEDRRGSTAFTEHQLNNLFYKIKTTKKISSDDPFGEEIYYENKKTMITKYKLFEQWDDPFGEETDKDYNFSIGDRIICDNPRKHGQKLFEQREDSVDSRIADNIITYLMLTDKINVSEELGETVIKKSFSIHGQIMTSIYIFYLETIHQHKKYFTYFEDDDEIECSTEKSKRIWELLEEKGVVGMYRKITDDDPFGEETHFNESKLFDDPFGKIVEK